MPNQRVNITTIDNPFDPFQEFSALYNYDMEKCYICCGYFDRISNVTDDMSQKEASKEIERAIDEIIVMNPFNNFKKVERIVKVAV